MKLIIAKIAEVKEEANTTQSSITEEAKELELLRLQSPLFDPTIRESNDQFRLALVQMLLDEVVFRLKVRVKKESRNWFSSDSRYKKELKLHEKQSTENNSQTLEALRGTLTARIKALDLFDSASYEGLKTSVETLLTETSNVSEKYVDSDPVQAAFEVVRNKGFDTVLQARCQKLCGEAEANENNLLVEFDWYDKIEQTKEEQNSRQQKKLGSNDLPPAFRDMSSKEKAMHELIYIKAGESVPLDDGKAVEISNNQLDDVEVASISSAGSAMQPVSVRVIGQLKNNIVDAIGKLYEEKSATSVKGIGTVRLQVNSKASKWRSWYFVGPSEHSTVSALLTAAEKLTLSEPEMIDAMRRIDRLSLYKTSDQGKTHIQSIRAAFEERRCVSYVSKVAAGSEKERNVLEERFGSYEKALQSYPNFLKARKNLDEKVSGLMGGAEQSQAIHALNPLERAWKCYHAPDSALTQEGKREFSESFEQYVVALREFIPNANAAQELVYFILYRNTFFEGAFFPFVWDPKNGLNVAENLIKNKSPYAELCEKVKPLSAQSNELYFVALLISFALVGRSLTDEACPHLYQLLKNSLDLKDSFAGVDQQAIKNAGLSWLLNYIPSSVYIDNIDLNAIADVKAALLGEKENVGIFSVPVTVVNNVASAPSSIAGILNVLEQFYTDVGKVITRGKNMIVPFMMKNLQAYPRANPEILKLYTLWQWFKESGTRYQKIEKNNPKAEFLKQYALLFARLESAVKGLEAIFPEEIESLIPALPANQEGKSLENLLKLAKSICVPSSSEKAENITVLRTVSAPTIVQARGGLVTPDRRHSVSTRESFGDDAGTEIDSSAESLGFFSRFGSCSNKHTFLSQSDVQEDLPRSGSNVSRSNSSISVFDSPDRLFGYTLLGQHSERSNSKENNELPDLFEAVIERASPSHKDAACIQAVINSFKYIFGGSALLTSAVTTKLFSDTRRDLESVTLEKRVVVLRNILSLYLHIETGGENNDRFNAWKDGVIESATAILSGKRGLEISALPNSTVKYLKLIAIIEQNFPGLSFVDEQRSASTESRSLLTGQDSPGHFARGKTMKAIIPVNAVVKKK